jgi:hypothetical protein
MSIDKISDSLNKLTSFSEESFKQHFDSRSGSLNSKSLETITQPHKSLQDVLRANLNTFHTDLERGQILLRNLSKSGLPTDPQTLLKASATEKPSADKPFDLLRDLLNYFDKLVRVSSAISATTEDYMPTVTEFYNDQIKYLYNEVFSPIIKESKSVLARIFTHDSLRNIPGLKDVLSRLRLDSLQDLDEQSKGFRESPIYSLDTVLDLLSEDEDFKKPLADYYFQYQVDPSVFLGSIKFDHAKLVKPLDNLDEIANYLVAKRVMDNDSNGLDSLASKYGFNPVFIDQLFYRKIDLQTLTTFIDNMKNYEKNKLKEQYLPYLKGEKSIESSSEYTTALVLQAYLRPDKGITIEELKNCLKANDPITVI